MNVPPTYQMPPPSDMAPKPKSGVPGWAKWVIGCGAMLTCCCPIGAAILFPVFAQAKLAGQATQSLKNIKQVSMAWNLYSSDFDDRACVVPDWNYTLLKYVSAVDGDSSRDIFRDPLMPKNTDQLGYGMNEQVATKEIGSFAEPEKVVVFALTTTPGKDAVVTKETIRKASRGPFRSIWATADGAARRALIDEAQRLQWKPVISK